MYPSIIIIQIKYKLYFIFQIRFQPVNDDKYFPVAHTCFNLLDLPRYQTKEKLKYYLLQAIQQTQGFSLVWSLFNILYLIAASTCFFNCYQNSWKKCINMLKKWELCKQNQITRNYVSCFVWKLHFIPMWNNLTKI